MLSFRALVGGFFIALGCSALVLAATAMILSMQLQTGSGLVYGSATLGGGAAALLLGMLVLLVRR